MNDDLYQTTPAMFKGWNGSYADPRSPAGGGGPGNFCQVGQNGVGADLSATCFGINPYSPNSRFKCVITEDQTCLTPLAQSLIEETERGISDLPRSGMQEEARKKLDQAKRELQSGNHNASNKLLEKAIQYEILAKQLENDNRYPLLVDRPDAKNWKEKLKRYGNFGGAGYTGGSDGNQPPINRMDEVFKQHDSAYSKADKDYDSAKNELGIAYKAYMKAKNALENERAYESYKFYRKTEYELEYQSAILQADKDLVARLEKIDTSNILIFMNKSGEKGKFYETPESDMAYRKKAIFLFNTKMNIDNGSIRTSEALLKRQQHDLEFSIWMGNGGINPQLEIWNGQVDAAIHAILNGGGVDATQRLLLVRNMVKIKGK